MSAAAAQVAGAVTVRPAGELTIAWVGERRTELVAALEQAGGEGLALDLTEVEELDTAGLQLLLALRSEAVARGVAMSVPGVSERVAAVLRRVGLDHDLRPRTRAAGDEREG